MKQILREKVRPQSSLIDYLIYDYQVQSLEVKFKKGKRKNQVRIYQNITQEKYEYILTSHSPGQALLQIISEQSLIRKPRNTSILHNLKKLFAPQKQYYYA